MYEIRTIPELLEDGARRWPDRVWCRTPEDGITRAEAFHQARRCAGGLAQRGIGAGDHVVIVLPNGLDFLRAWFGVMMRGAISVAMNPAAAESELVAVLSETSARIVIGADDLGVPAGVDRVGVEALLESAEIDAERCRPDQPASYIQSSGSTGKPKFVIETHAMYTMAAEGYPYWLELTPDDVVLTTLPLSHLNAQAYSALGSYCCGAELVLLQKFSASAFWPAVREYNATVVNAIGAMLEILMAREPTADERAHRLRYCYSAPAPTETRHREIEERFGLRLVIGYALSETPYGLVAPVDAATTYGSMGRPRQHPEFGTINEAKIVDGAGAAVPAGFVGELVLRNPAITPGYFGLPEETARLRDRDGWLHTGDLAYADDAGNYYFAGRLKEVIRRRGENLSPAEVEAVIDAHPAVSSSAVIGVPSPLTEDDVKAFVMLRPDQTLTAHQLGQWCAERLPPYKRPRFIEFVGRWPLTETQKIAKKLLPRERNSQEVDLEALTSVR